MTARWLTRWWLFAVVLTSALSAVACDDPPPPPPAREQAKGYAQRMLGAEHPRVQCVPVVNQYGYVSCDVVLEVNGQLVALECREAGSGGCRLRGAPGW
jgi:hypothetical protein